MAKEKTSKRVARVASKQLRNKGTSRTAKITAGSALTQYEPTKGKRTKKKMRRLIKKGEK